MKYQDFSNAFVDASRVSEAGNDDWYMRFGKRAFDLAFAVALLPLIVPVIAVTWLIARSDGGPGFFGHQRVGQNGVPFKCWKVRSMVNNASERLEKLLATDPVARAEWERDQKLTNDPRITRFGNFIRRSSLDELPQIFNVLKGDMSFVGPRPVVQDELEKYGPYKAEYLAMKPGITGLWQVSARNECSYDDRVQYDATYYRTVGLTTDCRVIALTANSVLRATGK